jgi:glycosyltransferase involved in cell wall biosynthesis
MKKVLAIVPFGNIYPPMNGGSHRCINILDQLCRYFETTVIIHQDEKSLLGARDRYPGLRDCRFICTKDFKKKFDLFSIAPKKIQNALRYRYWNRSLKGRASSDFLTIYPVLKSILKKQRFEYFILEDISVINLSGLIRRFQPGARIIYDAYNINSKLAETTANSGRIGMESYLELKRAESSLSAIVTDVFTCSNQDLDEIAAMNHQRIAGTVIPNGVNTAITITKHVNGNSEAYNHIIYCGSLDYLPNQEGMIWFCAKVFPMIVDQNPRVKLLVVGKGDPGAELAELLKHPSIKFYGMVENVDDYYKKAAVAIVPLHLGSGTRLKLLEAMGRRKAVVATSVGAEGIGYTNRENILIADDPASFAAAVIELLNNKPLAESVASSAFSFVKENYDWNVVGKKLEAYLNG